MANQNYWFPSQTGNYTLPNGDTLRFNIYYDNGGGASNTSTNALLSGLDKLHIPFESDPSGNKFRFATWKAEFINIDDVFENESILNDTYSNDTYVAVYLNGTLFWCGMVDFAFKSKSDWYNDGGTLKYRKIKIKFLDALSYFWTHDVDLSDSGIANGDSVQTAITDILALPNTNWTTTNYDTNIKITETTTTTYNLNELKIRTIDSSIRCSTFLKEIMNGFCCFIYTWYGDVNVRSRIGGTTKNIDLDDIIVGMKIKENANLVEYIKMTGTSLTLEPGERAQYWSLSTPITHSETSGILSENSQRNVEIVCDTVLKSIYTIATGDAITSLASADSSTNTNIYDATPEFASGLDIESGDLVDDNEPIGGEGTFIAEVIDDDNLEILDCGSDFSTFYRVFRGTEGSRWRWKFIKILKDNITKYAEYYYTSPDITTMSLRDITEYKDLEKRYVFNAENYRVKDIKADFVKDELYLELIQVA